MIDLAPYRKRATVLVIEDDRSLREMLRDGLRQARLDVRSALDGVSALWQIDQHTPDVIVLDLNLPGVNGIDILHELAARPRTTNVPVIVVTGTDWEIPRSVFATLRKPFTVDDLLDVVERAIVAPGIGSAT